MFKDNADAFSKGILTDIMEPIMGRGSHSCTFRLNVSALGGIGGAFRGSLGGL